MNPTLFLRIGSVVSLLFAAGHTMGALQSWSPPGETDVLRAMGSFRFDAEGVSRTYLDFYIGFGYTIGIFLLLQAVLLWQIAAMARGDPHGVRPLIGAFLLASVASALVSWRFIFAVPAVWFAILAACLGAALVTSRRRAPG